MEQMISFIYMRGIYLMSEDTILRIQHKENILKGNILHQQHSMLGTYISRKKSQCWNNISWNQMTKTFSHVLALILMDTEGKYSSDLGD